MRAARGVHEPPDGPRPPEPAPRLTPRLCLAPHARMPDQISVSEFIAETTEDYNSPTTSSFTTRLHNCRNTVTLLEEVGRGRRAPRGPPVPPLAAAARLAWQSGLVWSPRFLSRGCLGLQSHTPSGTPAFG